MSIIHQQGHVNNKEFDKLLSWPYPVGGEFTISKTLYDVFQYFDVGEYLNSQISEELYTDYDNPYLPKDYLDRIQLDSNLKEELYADYN